MSDVPRLAQEALGQLAAVKAELAAAQQAQTTLAKALQAAWAREEAAEQGTPHPDDAPKGGVGAGEVGVAEAGTLAAVLESAEGGDATMVRRRNDRTRVLAAYTRCCGPNICWLGAGAAAGGAAGGDGGGEGAAGRARAGARWRAGGQLDRSQELSARVSN